MSHLLRRVQSHLQHAAPWDGLAHLPSSAPLIAREISPATAELIDEAHARVIAETEAAATALAKETLDLSVASIHGVVSIGVRPLSSLPTCYLLLTTHYSRIATCC